MRHGSPVIAIDIDGTLTRDPSTVAELARCLLAQQWRVVFLTGGLAAELSASEQQSHEKRRRGQLRYYGLQDCEVAVCLASTTDQVAVLKGHWCRENAACILIDDTLSYCEDVRRLSPNTLVLRVIP